MKREYIFTEIKEERRRQNDKWGEQNHDPMNWIPILGEEYGEVCKHALETYFGYDDADTDYSQYRKELVQLVSVGVAMIESLDRNNRHIVEGTINGEPIYCEYGITDSSIYFHKIKWNNTPLINGIDDDKIKTVTHKIMVGDLQ